MNKINLDFVTYCIGNLSRRLGLTSIDVYERLKNSGILTSYIVASYDVLHTFSKEYLMDDLTEQMKETETFCNKIQKVIKRDEAYYTVLEAKYARIIEAISELHSLSLEEAVNIFYYSPFIPLLEEGVADLHCRSDCYLAEEIWPELKNTIV